MTLEMPSARPPVIALRNVERTYRMGEGYRVTVQKRRSLKDEDRG